MEDLDRHAALGGLFDIRGELIERHAVGIVGGVDVPAAPVCGVGRRRGGEDRGGDRAAHERGSGQGHRVFLPNFGCAPGAVEDLSYQSGAQVNR
jgi:hypothetical protein